MSEWVAISGYDLDKSDFRFIGGKRLFFCKARISLLSSSIDMGYGVGTQGVCDDGGA